jgi:hypothetical protein
MGEQTLLRQTRDRANASREQRYPDDAGRSGEVAQLFGAGRLWGMNQFMDCGL